MSCSVQGMATMAGVLDVDMPVLDNVSEALPPNADALAVLVHLVNQEVPATEVRSSGHCIVQPKCSQPKRVPAVAR
jgi:hypothetical protein